MTVSIQDIADFEGISEKYAARIRRGILKKLQKQVLGILDYTKHRGGSPIEVFIFINDHLPSKALIEGWKLMES